MTQPIDLGYYVAGIVVVLLVGLLVWKSTPSIRRPRNRRAVDSAGLTGHPGLSDFHVDAGAPGGQRRRVWSAIERIRAKARREAKINRIVN